MVQYWYTNGRPSWVQWANGPADLSALWTRTSNYLQFNWHGDAAVWVATDGNANNNGWTTNDPFGIYTASTPKDYYYWNGGWGYLYFSKLNLYYAHGRWYNPVNALWLSPNEKGDYLYGGDDPGQNAVNQVFLFSLGAFCQFRSDMGAGVTESLDLTFTKITGQPSFNEQSCKPNQNETSYQIGSAVTHAGTYSLSGIEIGGGLTLFLGGGTVEVGSLGTATPVAVPMSGIGMGMMAHGGGMLINNLRGDIGKIISSFAAKGGGSGKRSKINISPEAMDHVVKGHTPGGAESKNKSPFYLSEDIRALVEDAETTSPTRQAGGNWERIVDAGRMIGLDRNNGYSPTSIYTVITDDYGNLVTAFPGRPK